MLHRTSVKHGGRATPRAHASPFGTKHGTPGTPGARMTGFTLIELIIAITVLLVVILATAHIFGTASKVTGTGHASASVMQEAAVIERMLRNDIARLSPEGFFAIRQVAVPNNVHGAGQPLLNPMLRPDAWIRVDQLVFFADGVADMQTFGIGGGTANQSQAPSARVYYGHAFQLPTASRANVISNQEVFTHDPQFDVLPWHRGPVDMLRTQFIPIGNQPNATTVYQQFPAAPMPDTINGTQPEARQWLLARQAVALADDDVNPNPASNQKTHYLNNRTARSIFRVNGMGQHDVFGWTNEVRNGRMDGAASRVDDVWKYIRSFNSDWHDHRDIISAQLLYYPRAERRAPGPHRVDQALTNHVIGSAVSSFIVEWTWSDGTGDWYDDDGNLLCDDPSGVTLVVPCKIVPVADQVPWGFRTNWFSGQPFQPEQPWFGLNLPDRGVGMYSNLLGGYQGVANYKIAGTVDPAWANVERRWTGQQYGQAFGTNGPPFGDYPNVEVYEAIFGSNRNKPSAPNPATNWIDEPHADLAYTPWPTAIRVTMVLHDPQGRMEHGREIQFVIDLPNRVKK